MTINSFKLDVTRRATRAVASCFPFSFYKCCFPIVEDFQVTTPQRRESLWKIWTQRTNTTNLFNCKVLIQPINGIQIMNALQPTNTTYYCVTYVSLICCCCCCYHITSHNQVRGHRTGSSHSNEILPVAISAPGAEECLTEQNINKTKSGTRIYHSWRNLCLIQPIQILKRWLSWLLPHDADRDV